MSYFSPMETLVGSLVDWIQEEISSLNLIGFVLVFSSMLNNCQCSHG